ncbi:PTS system, trehalose-specific, IIBC component, partial [gut metagenome]
MIGSAIAAMISVGFGVQAISIGVGGLPGILSIFPKFWGIFLLAMAVAIIVPIVTCYGWAKTHLDEETKTGKTKQDLVLETNPDEKEIVLNAPMDGTVYPLNEIDDQAFASGAMGQGFAVDMTNGLVHAPCDGQ